MGPAYMNGETALYLAHLALALLLAPLLPGIINRVKAIFAGRRGRPLLQTYHDLAKLLRKGEVISQTTTWVFTTGPCVSLAAAACALALLPLGGTASPLAFAGDFMLAACLLGVGRFAIVLAALDTGSPFEGMGASREASLSALAEPALFLGIMVLAATSMALDGTFENAFSLSTLLSGQTAEAWMTGRGELLLLPMIFFLLLLVENCRIPVDDPNTHLELTMIHEVMVLDHSGPGLALILYGTALKLWFFSALVAGLVMPDLPAWQKVGAHLALVLLLAVATGIVESAMARLRMERVPLLLGGAAAMSGLALLLSLMR